MAEQPAQAQARRARMHLNDENNFMNLRDRLFHHMLVRVALAYCNNVPFFVRRMIEFLMLVTALFFLGCLLFVHLMSTRLSANCLENYNKTWPRDGIIRLEIVENLDVLKFKEEWVAWYKSSRSQLVCKFDPTQVLLYGPASIPAEIRHGQSYGNSQFVGENDSYDEVEDDPSVAPFHKPAKWLLRHITSWMSTEEEASWLSFHKESHQFNDPLDVEAENQFSLLFRNHFNQNTIPKIIYRMEYAQFYGLLRLPLSYRTRKGITTLHVRLGSEDSCFGDSLMLFTMKHLIGYEEAVMSSLRKLAINEKNGLGYLHNLYTNEHFHFITNGYSKGSYLTAAVLMVAFTFAISLLLRFSHHQIFVFIVEILHMFETAQPIQFPAAALLTVILALVGMEAIMSEIFADTSTAFYVILVVWIADQFDAICCQSATSRRYWLRFFYLYQFFFYAYQYRFGGQYGGIALLTSIAFVLHSMIYFFHHYEMPQILYQERLQRLFSEIEAMPRVFVLLMQFRLTLTRAFIEATHQLQNLSAPLHFVLPQTIEHYFMLQRMQPPTASTESPPQIVPGNSRSEDEPIAEGFEPITLSNSNTAENLVYPDNIHVIREVLNVEQIEPPVGLSTLEEQSSPSLQSTLTATTNSSSVEDPSPAEEHVAQQVVSAAIEDLFQTN